MQETEPSCLKAHCLLSTALHTPVTKCLICRFSPLHYGPAHFTSAPGCTVESEGIAYVFACLCIHRHMVNAIWTVVAASLSAYWITVCSTYILPALFNKPGKG